MNRHLLPILALLLGSLLVVPHAHAVAQTVDLGGAVSSGTLTSGNFTIGRLHFVVTCAGGFSVTQTGGRLYFSENSAAGDFRVVVTQASGNTFGLASVYWDQQSVGGAPGFGASLSAYFSATSTSIPETRYTGSTTISFTPFGFRTDNQLVIEDIELTLSETTYPVQAKFYLDDFYVDLDAVAPEVVSIVRQNPTTSPTNADSLTWRITISENVTGVDAADFVVYGTTAGKSVAGSGAVYDLTLSGGNLASLEGSVSFGFTGVQTIVNSSGLTLTDTSPSGANDNSYIVSNLHPPALTATGNNPTFTEDGAAVDLFRAVTATTNDTGQTFSSLNLTVTGTAPDDLLQFGSTAIVLTDGAGGALSGIAGYYNVDVVAGTATISIYNLSQSNAQMAALVDGMTFRNSGNNPGGTSRMVTLTETTDTGNYFNSATLNLGSTVAVTAVNDAPTLAPIAPNLTGISEDDVANAGQSVASFVGASISDPDTGAVHGIAVTVIVPGPGVWQYSVNNGTTWAEIGTVASGNALLLRANDRVRCLPDGIHAGNAAFTYCAWDQTGATAGRQGTKVNATGTGGTTPFSSANDSVSLSIASAAPNTFADWAADNFSLVELGLPAVSGPTADPDGAGVSNLMRYALDLPARGPVSAVTIVVFDGAVAPAILAIDFPVRAAAVGLTYQVQSSPDLYTWTTSATYTANGSKRQVLHEVDVPAGVARYFVRLRVAENTP